MKKVHNSNTQKKKQKQKTRMYRTQRETKYIPIFRMYRTWSDMGYIEYSRKLLSENFRHFRQNFRQILDTVGFNTNSVASSLA